MSANLAAMKNIEPLESAADPPSLSQGKKATREGRSLFALGSPILLVQLLQVSVVAADTIMAGRYSAQDLSGVAIGGSIWFPIFLLLIGLLSALTPIIAQLHGGKDYSAIAPNVYQSVWLALMIAPPAMAMVVFIDPLLTLIDAEKSIRPISKDYLQAMVLGLPAVLIYNVLRFYSDGVSLTRPAVAASFVGVLVNIPLNYVLINGELGFPELGGAGCGWASAISFHVMCLFMVGVVSMNKAYRAFYLFNTVFSIDNKCLKNLLKVGIPIGLAHFIESSMFGVIALFLASLGPMQVAAHQIALNVSALVFMIPLSMGMALTIRIGFLVGANQLKQARFTAFFGLAMTAAYTALSASLLFIFRDEIALIYNNEAEVVLLASTLLIYAAIFQLGDGLQVTAASALRGYKDTRVPMYIMVLTFWCFGLPFGYFLGLSDAFGYPKYAEGFWIGLVAGLFAAGGMLVLRLIYISRKFCRQADRRSHHTVSHQ